jgi:hypothetical protein
LRIPFGGNSATTITYADNSYSDTSVAVGDFVKTYSGTTFTFLNWKLEIKDNPGIYKGMNILFALMISMGYSRTLHGDKCKFR